MGFSRSRRLVAGNVVVDRCNAVLLHVGYNNRSVDTGMSGKEHTMVYF